MKNSRMSGFFRLNRAERLMQLKSNGWLTEADRQSLQAGEATLSIGEADRMIENVVGVFGLPLGVGPNFLINGRNYIVPLVVEEPSIVAALSNAARLAAEGGGIRVETTPPILTGQIQLVGMSDPDQAAALILHHRKTLMALSDSYLPRMVARGGGIRDLEVFVHRARTWAGNPNPGQPSPMSFDRIPSDMVVVHLHVDTGDAMGANAVNGLCESLAPALEELTGGMVCLRILSNLTDRSLVKASVHFKPSQLATESLSGEAVRDSMILASSLAQIDPYRAATHNKGIMNGVDAVALATGNDWRAIEAAAHAYAARSGRYTALSHWSQDPEGNLVGELEMPLKVGIVGGNLTSNPMVGVSLRILGVESAVELASVMGAVGLAQNFSALKALATDGIQRGHMRLHARSVAASAGTPEDAFDDLVSDLISCGEIKLWKAQDLLIARKKLTRSRETAVQ